MATHSSILAWRIPWTEEIGYYPLGCKELDTTETTYAPSPVEFREAPPTSSFPGFSEPP